MLKLNQFKHRSNEKELLDDFSLSGTDLEKNLQNLRLANQYLGGNKLIFNALSQVIHQQPHLSKQNLRIADLGCGGGDILRTLAQWINKKQLSWELIGVDANPVSVDFAYRKSQNFQNIHYQIQNIFSAEFQRQQFDIVLFCSVCHHFSDEELIKLFNQLKNQTRAAIIISDFHRHWLAYYTIKLLTHLGSCSYLEKHDGPMSIRKAFKRRELIQLLHQSGISNYQIKWRWPFRYQVLILL